jgi:mono/diheme cytochrome c family protein
MMKLPDLATAMLLVAPVGVLADPFPKADAQKGEKLVQESRCNACHVKLVGGDGTAIFTRADRKVKTAAGLLSQVRTCNTMLGTNWFPEDEADVAAYLNQAYYKFK